MIPNDAWEAADRFVAGAMRRDGARGLLHRKGIRDDLRQECCIEIIEKMTRFDPAKGVPVGGFLWPHFKGALKRVLRQWREVSWSDLDQIVDQIAPDEAAWDNSNGVQGSERSPDAVLSSLPPWFIEAGAWDALRRILSDDAERSPSVFDWWKVRASLVRLGLPIPVREPVSPGPDVTVGHQAQRRWRLWLMLHQSPANDPSQ